MHAPRRYRNTGDLPAVIPVFPLTGALLLPETRLPLNIFEPRYLAMVDAALGSYRMIGMIQPKVPGEEEDAAKKPALTAVGCAGRIVEFSETDDGRYLITLLGIARFRVSGERDPQAAFRQVAADYSEFAARSQARTRSDFGIRGVARQAGQGAEALSHRALDADRLEVDRGSAGGNAGQRALDDLPVRCRAKSRRCWKRRA